MLQKSTLKFLKDLKANNNRDWFMANKQVYEAAHADALQLIDKLIAAAGKFDEGIKGLDPKKCIMRIYRDIRFSKDKTPYKTNFGIWLSAKGKNADYPGYYLHIQPGNSFIAGGYWMPPPDHLKAIRQEIDYNQEEFQGILKERNFKKYFDGIDSEEKLSTTPKGYAKDHPAIEFLKMKSFTVSSFLEDKQLTDQELVDHIAKAWKALMPVNRFLQRAIS